MGVKAFTKAAVSDLKGKPQRGLLRSLNIFEKLTTVRAAKRILDDRPVCADSALRKLCRASASKSCNVDFSGRHVGECDVHPGETVSSECIAV
jgi:hypothetical protein